MLQSCCGVWVDPALDLKERRQVVLQKSFIVPLMSTTAMMRSRGCDIALTEQGERRTHSKIETTTTLLLYFYFEMKGCFAQTHLRQ